MKSRTGLVGEVLSQQPPMTAFRQWPVRAYSEPFALRRQWQGKDLDHADQRLFDCSGSQIQHGAGQRRTQTVLTSADHHRAGVKSQIVGNVKSAAAAQRIHES